MFNESLLNWIMIPFIPTQHIYGIKETELEREDSIFMSLESVTENWDSGF